MARDRKYYNLGTFSADGNSKIIDVKDFRHIVFSLGNTSGTTTTLTVKAQGAVGDDAPTFSSAASTTNQWDYIGIADLNDKSSLIAGATGVALSAASNGVSMYEVNTNGLDWICFEISNRSAGSATILVTAYANG